MSENYKIKVMACYNDKVSFLGSLRCCFNVLLASPAAIFELVAATEAGKFIPSSRY